jgi:hypothetical protein
MAYQTADDEIVVDCERRRHLSPREEAQSNSRRGQSYEDGDDDHIGRRRERRDLYWYLRVHDANRCCDVQSGSG